MDLKTYQADSMAAALEKVKKDLGREAVILHTRTLRKGGWLGFGGRTLVEITATRDVNVLPPSERRAVLGGREGRPASSATLQDSRRTAAGSTSTPPVNRLAVSPASIIASDDSGWNTVRNEMGELRTMVQQLLERAAEEPGVAKSMPQLPQELVGYYTALIQNEVADEIAREVMTEAQRRLEEWRAAHAGAGGTETLRQLVPAVLVETIERMLPPAEPVQLPPEGCTKFVALVGPTGVGKTTTIAKLAAHFKLRENRRVGLITIDTYRIAAVEQLKAYADILNIPLEIVLSPSDMPAALERMSGLDLVLIDTSGRSQKDATRLGELKVFLDTARASGGGGGLETHLVLSCTAHPMQIAEVAERFAGLGVNRVVFTKLDEAVGLGVILNCLKRLDLRLSYLTTGQDVPEDIEVGHRRRIAQLVLNPAAVAQKASSVADPVNVTA